MYYNVLPEEVKKTLRREYRMRLLTNIFVAVSFVGVIGGISLAPSYIDALSKETRLAVERETLGRLNESQDMDEAKTTLFTTREKIKILEGSEAEFKGSDLLAKVIKAKPVNIAIQSIQYEPKAQKHILTISGVAPTREDLVSFREALEKTTPFQKADIPISTLAKSIDVDFTITVEGSF